MKSYTNHERTIHSRPTMCLHCHLMLRWLLTTSVTLKELGLVQAANIVTHLHIGRSGKLKARGDTVSTPRLNGRERCVVPRALTRSGHYFLEPCRPLLHLNSGARMPLAIIRANRIQHDKLRTFRLRRGLVLGLAIAGVTDIAWEGISRDEVDSYFANITSHLPQFHFTELPRPCSGRTLIIEESEMFFDPAVFRLLLNWPGNASIEATHNEESVGLWAQSSSRYSREISVEIPDQQIFFLRERVLNTGERRGQVSR